MVLVVEDAGNLDAMAISPLKGISQKNLSYLS